MMRAADRERNALVDMLLEESFAASLAADDETGETARTLLAIAKTLNRIARDAMAGEHRKPERTS